MSRPGNVPGRVKRVVSCKRKTHHLLVVRKKQPTSGRMTDVTNKENEMSNVKHVQMSDTDPWGFTWTSNSNLKSGRRVCDQPEHRTLTEVQQHLHSFVCKIAVSLVFRSNFPNLVIFSSSQGIIAQ